ncbi:MAG: FAD-binding oxidoreductase [Candidatus Geothermincolia bacterium]
MSDYQEGKSRWWGWGDFSKDFDLDERAGLAPYLKQKAGVDLHSGDMRFTEPQLEEMELPEPRLDASVIAELKTLLGDDNVSTSRFDRVSHSMGKSYRDLLRNRLRRVDNPVDVVVWPRDAADVAKIIEIANAKNIAVVPFGGGSSVVGGVEPQRLDLYAGEITVDMGKMNQVLALDTVSNIATIQAGAQGPYLEEQLNAEKYTLGHFPESWNHSALGGWLAARAAGRQSSGYGKIEEMVISVRTITPSGEVLTRRVPATAAGPKVMDLMVGSEGTLGIITEAEMKVRPLPEVFDYSGLLFKTFEQGCECVREIMQGHVHPTAIRVSDEEETRLGQAWRITTASLKHKVEDFALNLLEKRGYSLSNGAFMVLGVEGEKDEVKERKHELVKKCKKMGGFYLGTGAGMHWYKGRYDNAYLRDKLINYGLMVDTLETATTWDNYENVYKSVQQAMLKAIHEGGVEGLVTCHLSHAYPHGASLYYIFIAGMAPDDPEGQWVDLKRAASDAMIEAGATITHHHGLGYEHSPWLPEEVGAEGMRALKAMKDTLDPKGIMNPGKIYL